MSALFLIRNKKNKIWGPLPKEKLVEQVLEGEFDPQDEFCEAGQYWFSLYEKEEVQKFLGVLPPAKKRTKDSDEEEITETETVVTETVTATVSPRSDEDGKTQMAEAKVSAIEEKTPSSSSLSFAPAQDTQAPYYEDSQYRVENPFWLKIFILALMSVVGFLVYLIFTKIT